MVLLLSTAVGSSRSRISILRKRFQMTKTLTVALVVGLAMALPAVTQDRTSQALNAQPAIRPSTAQSSPARTVYWVCEDTYGHSCKEQSYGGCTATLVSNVFMEDLEPHQSRPKNEGEFEKWVLERYHHHRGSFCRALPTREIAEANRRTRLLRPRLAGDTAQAVDWPPSPEALSTASPPATARARIGGQSPVSSEIEVLTATYGANCGARKDNVTASLGAACNGQQQCNYIIQTSVIGDPAYGCMKDYVAQYRCKGEPQVKMVSAVAEAGNGSEIVLDCKEN